MLHSPSVTCQCNAIQARLESTILSGSPRGILLRWNIRTTEKALQFLRICAGRKNGQSIDERHGRYRVRRWDREDTSEKIIFPHEIPRKQNLRVRSQMRGIRDTCFTVALSASQRLFYRRNDRWVFRLVSDGARVEIFLGIALQPRKVIENTNGSIIQWRYAPT